MKTDNNILNIFSVYSGIFYQIKKEEYTLLDDGQLPLVRQPSTCKKCYSRGYIGFSQQKFMYTPCSCVNKNIDSNSIKSKFNITS